MNDLRSLRRRAGLTQTELATKLAVGQSYVSDVEAGKRDLSVNAATKAAHLFGVAVSKVRRDTHDAGVVARLGPLADLVTKAHQVATKSATSRDALAAEIDELIDRVDEADVDDPAAVRRVLRALRQTITGEPAEKSARRDGFGRRIPADPERDLAGRKRHPNPPTERDAYGRKVSR